MAKPKINGEKIRLFILDIFHGGQEYRTTSEQKKAPLPLKAIGLFFCATALVIITIFSVIRITDISAEIASLKRQTVTLSAKKMSLENELDHRYSFAEIIEAAEALGFAENGGRVVYIETASQEQEEQTATDASSETPEETAETTSAEE